MPKNLTKIRIRLLGGVEEIGGNKILVENYSSKINFFLDFGKSFSIAKKYYEFPFSYPESVRELINIGALPDIPNLYTKSDPKKPDFSKEPETDIRFVFFSHAHLDHIGYAPLLNRNIPLYMGECAKKILEAFKSFVVRKSLENNWDGLNIETFKTGDTIEVKNTVVEPIHVDHSIPSSYGFLVNIEGKTIAYTGDFRLHGPARSLTLDFAKKLSREDLDIIITEATRADYSDYLGEKDVEELATKIVERSKGLTIVDFSRSDYDRFRTFHSVSLRVGKDIVAHPKIIAILMAINQCKTLRERINLDKIYIVDDGRKRLSQGEKELVEKFQGRIIPIDDIRKNPENYMLLYPIYSGGDVKRIRPPRGSIYILSTSEPIDEEREISFERIMNWMEQFGVATFHIHASGHANALDLKEFIETVEPKTVVPIHTLRPRLLKNFVNGDYKWLIPSKNQVIEL